jgi:hypothetical protein
MPDWGGKVAAWFGSVTAGSAAIAALIEAEAKPPLHGVWRVLFIALVVIASVAFVAFLLTGFLALWVAWRHRAARQVRDELAPRAEALSQELSDFLAERNRDDPSREWPLQPRSSDETVRQRQWADHTSRVLAFSTETMSRYQQRFAGRALAVFDDAVEAGLAEVKDRHGLQNPTNSIGIRMGAQQLSSIAHKARQH